MPHLTDAEAELAICVCMADSITLQSFLADFLVCFGRIIVVSELTPYIVLVQVHV